LHTLKNSNYAVVSWVDKGYFLEMSYIVGKFKSSYLFQAIYISPKEISRGSSLSKELNA
jgi:hypothetical protein